MGGAFPKGRYRGASLAYCVCFVQLYVLMWSDVVMRASVGVGADGPAASLVV